MIKIVEVIDAGIVREHSKGRKNKIKILGVKGIAGKLQLNVKFKYFR